MDPRLHVIGKRLAGVKRIVAVSGGKGGIGKSSVASVLALCMADRVTGQACLTLISAARPRM
jgi:ATP-binding protein involved in chromosome partitioning